jgi:hypothetical protein
LRWAALSWTESRWWYSLMAMRLVKVGRPEGDWSPGISDSGKGWKGCRDGSRVVDRAEDSVSCSSWSVGSSGMTTPAD